MPLPHSQATPHIISRSPSPAAKPSSMTSPPPTRLYFAYGSNLSLTQMASRCPTSKLHSSQPLAKLPGFRWVISPRGYANVLKWAPDFKAVKDREENAPEVHGMLWELQVEDERALDRYEGVGVGAYEKVVIRVVGYGGAGGKEEEVEALVYVDVREGCGRAREEYVGRMKRGLRDALRLGMSAEWVAEVVRPFIPAEEE